MALIFAAVFACPIVMFVFIASDFLETLGFSRRSNAVDRYRKAQPVETIEVPTEEQPAGEVTASCKKKYWLQPLPDRATVMRPGKDYTF